MPLLAHNINLTQGATFRRVFVYKSGGEVVDLTGYTARAQIRLTPSYASVIADMTTENGGITIDGPNGKISLYLPASDTAEFTFNTTGAVYDLELYHPTDAEEIISLVGGLVKLSLEVTRG